MQEATWEPEENLENTEALEKWEQKMASGEFGSGDEDDEEGEDEDDGNNTHKSSRCAGKRKTRDVDYVEEDEDEDEDDEDDEDEDDEYVPEERARGRRHGCWSSKQRKRVPLLNDRQKRCLDDDLDHCSSVSNAFRALVTAHPELYAEARGLLQEQQTRCHKQTSHTMSSDDDNEDSEKDQEEDGSDED